VQSRDATDGDAGRFGGWSETHPYAYALVTVVAAVAVLAVCLAALSGGLATFPFWFAYKLLLCVPIVLTLTWWQRRRRNRRGPT
jgi:membrane protein implicated in regulation of membrane protease activity